MAPTGDTTMLMTQIASTVTAIALALTLMIPLTVLVKAHVGSPAAPQSAVSQPADPVR